MTDVMPVENPWLEMVPDTDPVTGNPIWVLAPGQTSPLLGSDNAVALFFVFAGPANSHSLLDETGWVRVLEHHASQDTGNMCFQILAANTEDIGTEPEIMVLNHSVGSDRAARLVLVDNARVSGISADQYSIDSSEAGSGTKQLLNPNPLPEGLQRRINLFFAWGSQGMSNGWDVALNSDYLDSVPGTNRVYQRLNLSNPDFSQSWYVIPDPSGVFDSSEGYDHTVIFRGKTYGYTNAFFASIGIAYSDPNPLCNDPSHDPVTITITARGPIDIQVDPAE